MNRERKLTGGNSDTRDVGMNPADFIQSRLEEQVTVRWLDLCCGQGRALIPAANQLGRQRDRVEIAGLDPAGLCHRVGDSDAQFVVRATEEWRPAQPYDLIARVHGLHYAGDKLGTIARAVSWLADHGVFVGHLDPGNLRHRSHRNLGRRAVKLLRSAGLKNDTRRRLVRCSGPRDLDISWQYVGADDEAGPNFTGEPAVNS